MILGANMFTHCLTSAMESCMDGGVCLVSRSLFILAQCGILSGAPLTRECIIRASEALVAFNPTYRRLVWIETS